MAFQPVIKRARFEVGGFTPQDMLRFGGALLKSIQSRLDRGETISDSAAPALKPNYMKRKEQQAGTAIRDLRFTGRTRRGMRVLEAGQNYAVVGFSDPEALNRVRFNNSRSRQWGVSPKDEQALAREIYNALTAPVRVVERVA